MIDIGKCLEEKHQQWREYEGGGGEASVLEGNQG